jgi:hypothetical protein
MDTKANVVKTKSAIIGKMWINQNLYNIIPGSFDLPTDMTFAAGESYLINGLTFRTDRHLNTSMVEGQIKPLELKAGTRLVFFGNNKRPGVRDADYSVSVSLPVEITEAIISNNKKGMEAWRKENKTEVASGV